MLYHAVLSGDTAMEKEIMDWLSTEYDEIIKAQEIIDAFDTALQKETKT